MKEMNEDSCVFQTLEPVNAVLVWVEEMESAPVAGLAKVSGAGLVKGPGAGLVKVLMVGLAKAPVVQFPHRR